MVGPVRVLGLFGGPESVRLASLTDLAGVDELLLVFPAVTGGGHFLLGSHHLVIVGLLLFVHLLIPISFFARLLGGEVELRGIRRLDIAVVHLGVDAARHDGVVEVRDSSTL